MSQPHAEDPAVESALQSRIWLALFGATLIWLAFVLTAEIDRPWINGSDYNGAVWSQAAHNILRAGLADTAGASSGFYFGPLPIPAWGYYLHHPPLLHLAIAGLFSVLGEQEWVARLVPIGCSLMSVVFLWLLVRSCAGSRVAALTAAVFATLPMQLRYGAMVNFEPCVLMLILGALLCLRWHDVTGKPAWKYGALAFVLVGLWVDWAMHLFVIAICACWLLWRKNGDRRFAALLLGTTVLSALLFLDRILLLRPDAWQNLFHTFMFRLGAGRGGHFTEAQWVARLSDNFLTHFLPVGLLLGAVGAGILWKSRSRSKGLRWLGRAALSILLMDALFVGVFQNDSYIHQYLAFYFLAPIAIAAGLALDRLIALLRHLGSVRYPVPGAAEAAVFLLVLGLAAHSFVRTDTLVRQFQILDYGAEESPELIPELGRAIQATFSAETHVLCNFLPDYGPQLAYYAQRDLLNNLSEARFWRPYLKDRSNQFGGVIWISEGPAAPAILAELPAGSKKFLKVGSQTFCLWKRSEGLGTN
jgi:4-amino-4-deoxy-L-arabinose transferase-like glycosyltransferase